MPKKKDTKDEEPAPASDAADDLEEGKEPAPEGTKPMMISGKNMEKYELKTGSGLKDVVAFKEFDKEWVLAEIQEIGFYSEFFNFKEDVVNFPGDKIMIVADPDEKYGENWLLCTTEEGREQQVAVAQARVDAENAAKRAAEEAEAAKKAAEDAILNAVYEDKPIVARPWVTNTAAASAEEVSDLSERPTRGPLVMSLVRKRKLFGQPHTAFQDRLEGGYAEGRQQRDPNYELKQKVLDVGLQGVPPQSEAGSQTSFYRSVNKASQCASVGVGASEEERQRQVRSATLQTFLNRVVGDMEDALQRNETFDVFQPPCSAIALDAITLGSQGDNSMQELKTFTDLEFSKNKALPAIDWHPTRPGEVVVAATNSESFGARIAQSGKAAKSYLLVWHFTDLIHPQLMLESPHDMRAFRFNPTNPSLVAAGCTSGQVLLWDIADAHEQLRRRKAKEGKGKDDEDEEGRMPPVQALSLSHIDSSHRRPVTDLHWLPPGMEISSTGATTRTTDSISYQFMTIAGDGQACVWDVRYKEIAKKNPKMSKELKPNKDGTMPEIPWTAHYKVALTKLEGVGELGLCRLDMKCLQQSTANLGLGGGDGNDESTSGGKENAREQSFSSQFLCSTEEGEMVFADWNPKSTDEDDAGGKEDKKKKDQDVAGPEYVQWMSHPHFRPSVALQRSPFFEDICVDITDWSFSLWKDGLQMPLFYSPMSNVQLTTGRWSPQRPGVLFIARDDGKIEVWDFTDQSHRASVVLDVAPVPIISLEFSPANQKRQLVAVGDNIGNLHILDTPSDLMRPLPNEMNLVSGFLERELNHVNRSVERMAVREEEREAQEKEAEMRKEQGAVEEAEPSAAADAKAKEFAQKQEEYLGLEVELRQQLGLEVEGDNDEDDDD